MTPLGEISDGKEKLRLGALAGSDIPDTIEHFPNHSERISWAELGKVVKLNDMELGSDAAQDQRLYALIYNLAAPDGSASFIVYRRSTVVVGSKTSGGRAYLRSPSAKGGQYYGPPTDVVIGEHSDGFDKLAEGVVTSVNVLSSIPHFYNTETIPQAEAILHGNHGMWRLEYGGVPRIKAEPYDVAMRGYLELAEAKIGQAAALSGALALDVHNDGVLV